MLLSPSYGSRRSAVKGRLRCSSSPGKPKAMLLCRATRCVRAAERQRKRRTFPSWARCACPHRLARCWTIRTKPKPGHHRPHAFSQGDRDPPRKLLRRSGEDQLNRLRDEARRLAPALGREKEFTALNAMHRRTPQYPIGSASNTAAKARRRGLPSILAHGYVRGASRRAPSHAAPYSARRPERWNDIALLRGFFSNFIEGTEFAVEEAAAIVFQNQIPSARPQDAHDILGTYRIVADPAEMARTPDSFAELERLLKRRHAGLHARPDKRPGQ